jgi:hypothetical protein
MQAQLERDALKAEAREAEIIGKLARQELNDECVESLFH